MASSNLHLHLYWGQDSRRHIDHVSRVGLVGPVEVAEATPKRRFGAVAGKRQIQVVV